MRARHGDFRILLICPPPVLEQGPIRADFTGARDVSLRLPQLYAALAEARGVLADQARLGRHDPEDVAPWDNAYERFLELFKPTAARGADGG